MNGRSRFARPAVRRFFNARSIAAFCAIVVLGVEMGCGESTAPPESVATVTVAAQQSTVLVPGGTEMLVASPKGASGKVLTGRSETWSSSDTSIVSVVAGLVTGGRKGTATITVSVEGVSGSVDVEVRDGVVISAAGGSFSLTDGSVSIAVPPGAISQPENISVKVAAAPPPARRLVDGTAYDFGPGGLTFLQPVTVTIKYDPSKVTAGSPESGLALYEATQGSWHRVPGSAVDLVAKTVSASVPHFSTYGVLMQPIVDTVRIAAPTTGLVVKTTFQFSATVKDSAGETLSRTVTWTSSAPTVLQIDPTTGASNALVPGTATITATADGKTGTALVTVVPGAPAHMVRVTAETVDGAAGVALATSPAVQITDAFGNGIAGFNVTFAVVSGGGTVTGGSATTSVNGFASPTTWTLGSVAGQNTLSATAAGLPESPLTFTAIGNAGAAGLVAANSPTTLSGTAGGLIATLPSVKVTDAFGNPVTGATVVFAPGSGSGSVTGGSVATNNAGIATVGSWRLGTTAGSQTLLASVSGAGGSPVTFTATAAAPIPTSMVIAAGDGQTAVTQTAVAVNPAVRITDPAGVPVQGVVVSFAVTAGGGVVSGATVNTDANGVAAVGSWTLGSSPGQNTLSVTALSLPAVTFNAAAVPPTPVAISLVAGQGQTTTAGVPVPIAPSVKVTDSGGRGVPGVSVTFSVTSGGGSITGASTVTDNSGIATVGSWTPGNGSNSLSASAPGLSGSPVIFLATGVPFIQLVTFGDSNTDYGFAGSSPTIQATSYVSNGQPRLGPTAPNNQYQLAGKIEAKWKANRPESIRVVNHGIASSRTGTGRTGLTSPHALEVVGGFTRFEGEVLGLGYPWSGGESRNSAFPNGPILRVQAFKPRPTDFVYVSLGTNDLVENVSTDSIGNNLGKLVDFWVGAGLPASHFIITTIPPSGDGTTVTYVPGMNVVIRRLAAARGITLIDLSTFVSNDDGDTWKSASLHIDGDLVHYSEAVRTWLADRVFDIINAP